MTKRRVVPGILVAVMPAAASLLAAAVCAAASAAAMTACTGRPSEPIVERPSDGVAGQAPEEGSAPAVAARPVAAEEPAGTTTRAGRPDPFIGLVLEDQHGRRVRFAEFKGKVRVFDIWATWCGPCRMGIPALNEIYDRYRGRGLVVVGIAVDSSPAEIVEFQRQIPLRYPSAIATPEVDALFGATDSVPTTFIVDRSGRVTKRFVGYVSPRILERAIERLL